MRASVGSSRRQSSAPARGYDDAEPPPELPALPPEKLPELGALTPEVAPDFPLVTPDFPLAAVPDPLPPRMPETALLALPVTAWPCPVPRFMPETRTGLMTRSPRGFGAVEAVLPRIG